MLQNYDFSSKLPNITRKMYVFLNLSPYSIIGRSLIAFIAGATKDATVNEMNDEQAQKKTTPWAMR
jgi:hypothetical protein